MTGSNDEAGIAEVVKQIDAFLAETTTPYQYRQVLFGTPWVMRDGRAQRWQVPELHPSAAAIASLDARLAKRRAESRANVASFAEAATKAGPSAEGRA